jgi:hypothetical protein
MAKNSDKRSLLDRRKREFDHAIAHGFDQVRIDRCAERVRNAVIAVLKKNRARRTAYSEKSPSEEAWANMSIQDVIQRVRRWDSRPSEREIDICNTQARIANTQARIAQLIESLRANMQLPTNDSGTTAIGRR